MRRNIHLSQEKNVHTNSQQKKKVSPLVREDTFPDAECLTEAVKWRNNFVLEMTGNEGKTGKSVKEVQTRAADMGKSSRHD